MAATDRSNADLRRHLDVDAPPPPIPKDIQGSNNPIPLSPQWLLSKSGENKLGMTGDPHTISHHTNHPDAVGNGEDSHDSVKKRDVFRPSLFDSDTVRRDRWRDEERDTNSATRRDRWRETEKELGDTRKIERWSDNTTKHSEEARRPASERWTDSPTREKNQDQRREGKWNTRWGPDDKESENWREKSDSGKDLDGSREKIMPKDVIGQGKDADKEGEQHSRSWKANSFLARGRGDTSHHQSLNKQPMFGSGRGKGENNAPSVFSAGRGRVNSSTGVGVLNNGSTRPYPLGFLSERSDGVHGDPSTLRYSRMKLLDVYRTTDLRNFRVPLEGFAEVPSLIGEEPLEPLALAAPSSEELVTLKGIDKGDIVSSGVPQVAKDGSTVKSTTDSSTLRQPRIGSRENSTMGLSKDESTVNMKRDQPSYLENTSHDNHLHLRGYDPKVSSNQNLHPHQESKSMHEALRSDASVKHADEANNKEGSTTERTSLSYSGPWRSTSAGERSHESSHDYQAFSTGAGARTSGMGWLHSQNSMETGQKNGIVSSSFFGDDSQWRNSNFKSDLSIDSKIRRQPSGSLDQEREVNLSHGRGDPFISRDNSSTGKFPPYPSPEELTLFYKDPHGRIQGPFSGIDLIGWFEAGYFGIDLPVRIASAPADEPFSLLGDVMPHLRAKARAPPGFAAAKVSEDVEEFSRGSFNSLDYANSTIEELGAVKNVQRNRHEASTDAENRYLESLMSGSMGKTSLERYSSAEGIQGYGGPAVGGENMNDMNYLLAQRMSIERQRSIPNSAPFWHGRDTSLMTSSKPDVISESPSSHLKFLPSSGEVPRQIPPQQVDFISLLQAAADKSSSPAVSSAVSAWSGFPELQLPNNFVHGGMNIIRDRADLQQNQHSAQIGFGAQQQIFHQPNQPSLTQMLNQHGDHSSGVVPPEKTLASEISKDPQMLNLLQQQYLMSQIQLQSQSPVPGQLSMLDKYLLLKQQQKQEQQQQQLLLQQQQHLLLQKQQQLLSQVLSGHQPHQQFTEPSFGLNPSVAAGSASVDQVAIQQMYEALRSNQQLQVFPSLDSRAPTSISPNVPAPKDASYAVNIVPAGLKSPHEMFDHNIPPNEQDSYPVLDKSVLESVTKPKLPISGLESLQNNAQEAFRDECAVEDVKLNQEKSSSIYSDTGENRVSFLTSSGEGKVSKDGSRASEAISLVSDQVDELKISSDRLPEVLAAETVKGVDTGEVKKPAEKKSEKKSKKQKNSKAKQISEVGKGPSKMISSQQQSKPDRESVRENIGGIKEEIQKKEEPTYSSLSMEKGAGHSLTSAAEPLDYPHATPASVLSSTAGDVGMSERNYEHRDDGISSMNTQASSNNRGWRPAPGLKPKSLLEIQLEEQRRVQRETIVSETSAPMVPPSSIPWVGVVAGSDDQLKVDSTQISASSQIISGSGEHSSMLSKNKKGQLHDLLAEEVLAKSNEGDTSFPDEIGMSLQSYLDVSAENDVTSVLDDFVEAKDTKKSRRKAAKAKAAGPKASPPVASTYLSAPPVLAEKSKNTYQVQQSKEILPVPPAGASLGDYIWKGEQTNYTSSPAWSTDSAKIKKPASLREIQKEQEKRNPSFQNQIPVPTPAKVQPTQNGRGSGSSWPAPGTSPSKTASPSQIKVTQTSLQSSSQSKSMTEDDLFWGPLDQIKQDTKKSDFPSLANPTGLGGKGTSTRGTPGKKNQSVRAEHSISTSQITGSKGTKDAGAKHSEAMDFRDWCESELVKLTGTNDTSFLEFCIKQTTSEAEMLLRDNLGYLDRNHEFINKFLNYKDFLAQDVIEIAFQAQPSHSRKKTTDNLANNKSSGPAGPVADMDGGGKKKGKKGKKVSPAVLGFSVVSNRIMMGEIQTIED